MTSPSDPGDLLALAAAALALLVVRAVGAAFEAALVAVGSPRAQELARPPDAGGRAELAGARLPRGDERRLERRRDRPQDEQREREGRERCDSPGVWRHPRPP